MHAITPCLWFDGNAEAAFAFYAGIFEDCEILDRSYYGEAGPGPKGSVLTLTSRLRDQTFIALNGGPQFPFTPAISFFVACEDQAEVDRLWAALLDGGAPNQCGWLTDRFGLSWQIVPRAMLDMLKDPDPGRVKRTMEAMFTMSKLDIAALTRAYEQA